MSAPWLEAVGGTTTRLAAGDHHRGSAEDEVLFVEEGLVVVRALDEGHRNAFAQVRRAPSVIGFERLGSMVQSYELHAVTNVVLRVVATEELQALAEEASAAHRSLIRCCAETLGANLEDRLAMSGSATVRLARLLLSGSDGGVRFSRLPRHLWAETLGMRPETLSRALRTLHERGLLTLDGDRVEVIDSERLEHFVTEGDD